MYRKTVIVYNSSKYTKTPASVVQVLSLHESGYHKTDGSNWICRTCDITLKRGKLTVQSVVNNLRLQQIPEELAQLNALERRLIRQRIPFMKMVALPSGRHHCVHGPAVNIPTNLDPVCSLLPRLPSQTQILSMKLKRKLCYRRYYMYDYVRPDKIMAALQWLKQHNPLYKDIIVHRDWEQKAAGDDQELWNALTSQSPTCPPDTASNGT